MPKTLPETLAESNAKLLEQHYLIEKLKLEIAALKRARFGASSEVLNANLDQLQLALDALGGLGPQEVPVLGMPPQSDASHKPTKPKPSRAALPDHLDRETVEHIPYGGICDCCGQAMHRIGEDVTEVLDYRPARFVVKRHLRPKMACRRCDTVRQSPAVSQPILKGKPGPGLLANVLVSKYADHLPLYRQSGIYAREGVDLSRSTMVDWVAKSTALVRPLVDAIGRHVMAGPAIHTDDTPVGVLAPGMGRTKTGRVWTYVRDERDWQGEAAPAVFYRYSPDRKGVRPQSHLKDYRGYLHADGYSGYEQLFKGGKITEVACLAHVRRKFFDIQKATGSPVAAEALKRIAALYGIEKRSRLTSR